jgi:hypothetical protein
MLIDRVIVLTCDGRIVNEWRPGTSTVQCSLAQTEAGVYSLVLFCGSEVHRRTIVIAR